MSWRSAPIELPEEWWDRLRDKERIPSWFTALTRFVSSVQWTHMHTQTFRLAIRDPFNAARSYKSYLAEHSSTFQLTDVFWAVEQHPGGHGCHIHALWRTSYDALREFLSARDASIRTATEPLYKLVKRSGERSLGFARLWPIEEGSCQVVAYCLKYVVKSLTKLESGPIPMPWEPQQREQMYRWETYSQTS